MIGPKPSLRGYHQRIRAEIEFHPQSQDRRFQQLRFPLAASQVGSRLALGGPSRFLQPQRLVAPLPWKPLAAIPKLQPGVLLLRDQIFGMLSFPLAAPVRLEAQS
jgi:hypothetical protein